MTADRLATQLDNASPDQRLAAAQTLARMGEEASPAAAALAKHAADPDLGEWCVGALEELGPPPAGLAAELGRLVASGQELTAYWSATLLGRLGPAAAGQLPQLLQAATQHADAPVRERAVWAIGKLGPAAVAAVSTLRKISQSGSPRVKRLAEQALEAVEG